MNNFMNNFMNTKNRVTRNYSSLTAAIYGGLFLLAASCKKNSYSTNQPKNTQTQQHTLQQNASPKVYHTPEYNPTPSKNGVPDAQKQPQKAQETNVPQKIQQNTICTPPSPLNTAPLSDLNTHENDAAKVPELAKDTIEINDIYKAALSGDHKSVKKLLNKDINNLNIKGKNGCTVLHWAAHNGKIETIKLLASYENIDLNAQNNNGSTALHFAAKMGHKEAIKYLIGCKNIKLDAKNNGGNSPYDLAIENKKKYRIEQNLKYRKYQDIATLLQRKNNSRKTRS